MIGEPTVCLVSGGPDSLVLLHFLADEGAPVTPIFVQQGLRWEEVELAWLRRFLTAAPRPEIRPLVVLSLPLDDVYPADQFGLAGPTPGTDAPDETVYLPGRNLTLLAKAAPFAALSGSTRIALGVLSGNPFPDATPTFLEAMESAIRAGLDADIRISAPFRAFRKERVLLLGKDLPLELTFSCISPAGDRHCGDCNKCEERRRAFRLARMADPTEYEKG